MIKVTRQKEHSWRKRIQREHMRGSTDLLQQGGKVNVQASVDHKQLCIEVFGKPNAESHSESYLAWSNVKAVDIVDLLYRMDNQ